jgi:hypothetical protein
MNNMLTPEYLHNLILDLRKELIPQIDKLKKDLQESREELSTLRLELDDSGYAPDKEPCPDMSMPTPTDNTHTYKW